MEAKKRTLVATAMPQYWAEDQPGYRAGNRSVARRPVTRRKTMNQL